jgi:hypothetical protein
MLSGFLAGIIVGGVGGRLAMRFSALAGGSAISGLLTENGNVVGDITVEGISFIFISGAIAGVFGGLLYVAARGWLPVSRPWRGAAFGVLLLLAFGSGIIDGNNPDFSRFGPPVSNIGLFASLFILFGIVVAPIAERLDRAFPPPSHGKAATFAYALLAVVSVFPVFFAVGLTLETALFGPLFLLYGLALVPGREPAGPPLPASSRSRRATGIGYGLIAVPCLLGLALDVKAISDILGAAG